MKIEDQFCTLEQSKRLKEFGVIAETLFWWMEAAEFDEEGKKIIAWHPVLNIERGLDCFSPGNVKGDLVDDDGEFHETRGDWTAFSVAELGEMIKMVGLYSCVNTVLGGWAIHHVNGYKDFEFPQPGNVNSYDTEAEARADILIHLIESKLITVEEINNRLTCAPKK